MFKKLTILLMLFVLSANVTFAAGFACDGPGVQGETANLISTTDSTSSTIDVSSSQNDGCGDFSKSSGSDFHFCHFGHCSIVVPITDFSPSFQFAEYVFVLQHFFPDSVPSNLFRPPIA